MKLSDIAVESAALTTSSKVTAGGGAVGLLGFLSQVNWLGIGGFIIAIVGLLVNAYFQVRRDRRETARAELEREESKARIEALKDKCAL